MLFRILNIVLLIYFYFENRKLKGFEIKKKLAVKRAELRKLINNHDLESTGMAACYYRPSEEIRKKEDDFYYRESCLEAEIKYLKKLKKYKWLFGK